MNWTENQSWPCVASANRRNEMPNLRLIDHVCLYGKQLRKYVGTIQQRDKCDWETAANKYSAMLYNSFVEGAKTDEDVAKSYAATEAAMLTAYASDWRVVIADNMYARICEKQKSSITVDGKNHFWKFANFNNCQPLFGNCFVEFKGDGPMAFDNESGSGSMVMAGGYCMVQDVRELENKELARQMTSDGVRWSIVVRPYTYWDDGELVPGDHMHVAEIAEDGKLMRAVALANRMPFTHLHITDAAVIQTLIETFSFMNCRNIELVDTSPAYSQKPKWYRRQKLPELRYHTLRILKDRKRYRREGEEITLNDTEALDRAEHFRSGSVATYTKEAPLFGKLVGSFYRPPTTVNRGAERKVIKDYVVEDQDAASEPA